MNGLALFCTLHADGPASLRVLREAGCLDLAGFEFLGPERLADLLEIEPAAARRLMREARGLAERLGEGALEREETPPLSASGPLVPPSVAPVAPMTTGIMGTMGTMGTPGVALPTDDRRMLERVLDAWRDRDRSEPVPADARRDEFLDDSRGEPVRDTVLGRAEELALRRESELHGPEPEPERGSLRGPELLPHALDGLDEATARALRASGLETLGELADAEPLEIAESTGLSYSRARRLVFLAGRRLALLEERVSPADRPASTDADGFGRDLLPRATPAATPRSSPPRAHSASGEGSGGPFA